MWGASIQALNFVVLKQTTHKFEVYTKIIFKKQHQFLWTDWREQIEKYIKWFCDKLVACPGDNPPTD